MGVWSQFYKEKLYLTGIGWSREENRHQEIIKLTSEGKVPHEEELAKHPEKSPSGRMCECSPTRLSHLRQSLSISRAHGTSRWIDQREFYTHSMEHISVY